MLQRVMKYNYYSQSIMYNNSQNRAIFMYCNIIIVCCVLKVTLWKENMEGGWVCVSEVDKGQEGQTQQPQISQ